MPTRPVTKTLDQFPNDIRRSDELPSLGLGIRDWHQLNAARQIIVSWFWVALVVSVVLVLAIPVRYYLPHLMPRVLSQMQLTHENNLAVWWSGALLFMLALHAYDAHIALRERTPKVARAWAILTAILIFLSADEIGSMHERLSVGDFLGGWGLLLPLGAVIGVALLYALQVMWQGGEDSRRNVVPLFVGFAILGSAAIQEFIAYAVEWKGALLDWILADIEEGSELLGMIILLRVMLRPTMEILDRPVPSDRRLFMLLPDQARNIFVLLVAFVPVFTILGLMFEDHRGRLSDWLAVITFLIAGLAAFSEVISGEKAKRGRLICITGLSLLASMSATSIPPTKFIVIGDLETGRVQVLALVSLLICGLWLGTTETLSRKLILLVAGIGVWLLLAPVLVSGATYSFLTTQVLAILVSGVAYVAMKTPERPLAGAL